MVSWWSLTLAWRAKIWATSAATTRHDWEPNMAAMATCCWKVFNFNDVPMAMITLFVRDPGTFVKGTTRDTSCGVFNRGDTDLTSLKVPSQWVMVCTVVTYDVY